MVLRFCSFAARWWEATQFMGDCDAVVGWLEDRQSPGWCTKIWVWVMICPTKDKKSKACCPTLMNSSNFGPCLDKALRPIQGPFKAQSWQIWSPKVLNLIRRINCRTHRTARCWDMLGYISSGRHSQQKHSDMAPVGPDILTFMEIESLVVRGVLILQSRWFTYFPVPCCESECLDMLTVVTVVAVVRLALGLPWRRPPWSSRTSTAPPHPPGLKLFGQPEAHGTWQPAEPEAMACNDPGAVSASEHVFIVVRERPPLCQLIICHMLCIWKWSCESCLISHIHWPLPPWPFPGSRALEPYLFETTRRQRCKMAAISLLWDFVRVLIYDLGLRTVYLWFMMIYVWFHGPWISCLVSEGV